MLAFDNWPMLLLGRLFDRRAGLVIYRKRGIEILIDHAGGDQAGTRQCIATDMYTRYLPHFSLAGPLCVLDLGANGGGFPLMLRIQGFELKRAVCVEMNPSTCQRLLLNLSNNLGADAIAVNAAVCGSGADAEILMRPTRGGTGESMYGLRADASATHVSVPTTTLRAIYERYFAAQSIDICKVDIEGAEYEAFEAAPDELLVKIRHLIVEFHDPARTPALLSRIRNLGFQQIIEESHKTGERTEVYAFRGPAAVPVSAPAPSAS